MGKRSLMILKFKIQILKSPFGQSHPLLYNPTNFDVDAKWRIWVAEGVNYRRSKTSAEGDRVVVLEDTDLDGFCR